VKARVDTVLDEIEARIISLREVDAPTITFARGAKTIARNDGPPRIVWVPGSGRFGPAEKTQRNPVSYLTRVPSVMAHCWGEDYGQAEDLVHRVLRAVHEVLLGSYEPISEEWPPNDDGQLGELGIVTFAIRIPVLGPKLVAVKPTDFDADTEDSAAGDGWLDWRE
jgi:hypothetical protein